MCGTANPSPGRPWARFSCAASPAGITFSLSEDVFAVPSLLLACLAYLAAALPGSVLGLLWPSIQLTFHAPAGALGLLLLPGTAVSVLSSTATGRVLSRLAIGPVLTLGTLLIALALGVESVAPSLWVFTSGTMVFGAGFGAIDSALNAHAASRFGARDVNWMHASYGLGSAAGPLLVTVLLSDGLGWRRTYGAMGVGLAGLAVGFLLTRRTWVPSAARLVPPPSGPPADSPRPEPKAAGKFPAEPKATAMFSAVVTGALAFAGVEAGIEAGAGLWGYVFLTSGRGLPAAAAGAAVAAYGAMMFAGRAVLGPVAERVGSSRVLAVAVAGVALGAAVMSVPGPGAVAAIGLAAVGLAAAPVFPLLVITTARRIGTAPGPPTTRMVSLQVSAATAGSALLPAAAGLVIGALGAGVLAPALLLLSLAMCGLHGLLSRWAGRPAGAVVRPAVPRWPRP
jgi:fucose permease